MKLGLQLNSFDWTGGPERFGATLIEIASTAEEAGFDRIAVADGMVPNVDRIKPLEIIGREVVLEIVGL